MLFSVTAIGGAIMMLNMERIMYMIASAAVTFLSLAGIYVLLHAEFLAFVQILIYAGAITILMIFGIVLTKHEEKREEPKRRFYHISLFAGVVGLFAVFYYVINQSAFPAVTREIAQDQTKEIGLLIYSQYVIPFELVSILLTIALIGAIIIAKREGK